MATETLESSIIIPVGSARIWAVLTDLANYGNWNPLMRSVKGSLQVGQKLTIYNKLPSGRMFYAKPKVTVLRENAELRWKSHLYFPGLYDAEHFFQIEELAANKVRVTHGERYTGILVKPILKNTKAEFETVFGKMSKALKKEVLEASNPA